MNGKKSKFRTIFLYGIRLTGCLTLGGFLWMGLIQDDQVRHARHVPEVRADARTCLRGNGKG